MWEDVPKDYKGRGFEIKLIGGKVLRYAARTESLCKKWIEALELSRKQSVNILEALNIDITASVDSAAEFDVAALKKGKASMLLCVSGHRKIWTYMVEKTYTSLNTHSVFILDAGVMIFQWNGKKASRIAKAKALDVVQQIRMKERGGHAKVFTLDQGLNDTHAAAKLFWAVLGGGPDQVNMEEVEDYRPPLLTLYRIPSLDKRGKVTIVHESPLFPKRDILNHANTYVLDAETEIYIWVGSNSNAQQRKVGSPTHQYPLFIIIVRNHHPTHTVLNTSSSSFSTPNDRWVVT